MKSGTLLNHNKASDTWHAFRASLRTAKLKGTGCKAAHQVSDSKMIFPSAELDVPGAVIPSTSSEVKISLV